MKIRLMLWVNGGFLSAFFLATLLLSVPARLGYLPDFMAYLGSWFIGLVGAYLGYQKGRQRGNR